MVSVMRHEIPSVCPVYKLTLPVRLHCVEFALVLRLKALDQAPLLAPPVTAYRI